MEGQIPSRVPRVFPLVGHGNNVLVQHMEPLRVPGLSVSGMERVGVVLVQPVVTVEEEELLAPEHSCDGLAHHVGRVTTHRWRHDRLVKLIGFTKPINKDFVKLLFEAFGLLVRRTVRKPQANHFGLTGAYIHLVVRRNLGSLFARVHRALVALHAAASICFRIGFSAALLDSAIHADQSLRNHSVGKRCSPAAFGPRLTAVILTRMSSGPSLAYSTKTSKYLSSLKTPVSRSSYSMSFFERWLFVSTISA